MSDQKLEELRGLEFILQTTGRHNTPIVSLWIPDQDYEEMIWTPVDSDEPITPTKFLRDGNSVYIGLNTGNVVRVDLEHRSTHTLHHPENRTPDPTNDAVTGLVFYERNLWASGRQGIYKFSQGIERDDHYLHQDEETTSTPTSFLLVTESGLYFVPMEGENEGNLMRKIRDNSPEVIRENARKKLGNGKYSEIQLTGNLFYYAGSERDIMLTDHLGELVQIHVGDGDKEKTQIMRFYEDSLIPITPIYNGNEVLSMASAGESGLFLTLFNDATQITQVRCLDHFDTTYKERKGNLWIRDITKVEPKEVRY